MNNIMKSFVYAESWNVAFRVNPSGDIISNREDEFKIIPNSFDFWAADPMVFEFNNEIYIFAELYDYRLRRGTIGYTKFDGKNFAKWKQVIVEDFHLSYPNIFIWNNQIFMMPESSASGQLYLYKAIEFPNKWEKAKIIASDVRWVDTTFYQKGENFIAFTESIDAPISDYILCLDKNFNIISKTLLSTNENTLRCGGRIFDYKNSIVRVCQDCSEKYGGALIFREMSKDFQEEKSVIKICAENLKYDKKIFLDGIHTYTSIDNMEVIDIKTRRFNIKNLFYRFVGKIRS